MSLTINNLKIDAEAFANRSKSLEVMNTALEQIIKEFEDRELHDLDLDKRLKEQEEFRAGLYALLKPQDDFK